MTTAATSRIPALFVLAAAATYSGLLASCGGTRKSHDELRASIKSISSWHSLITSVLSVLALTRSWDTQRGREDRRSTVSDPNRLDDSTNILIQGKSSFANFITAWEAGYLIYDTGAILLAAYYRAKKGAPKHAVVTYMVKDSPVFLVHHFLLASALLYLQTFIARGREKGVKIILAFFLMNATNPLLHLRWRRKKMTGRRDVRLDSVFAATFALTRFGTVYWVLKAYGKHHSLGPLEALQKQRWQCQAGTELLVGLNAVWWLGLVRQIVRQTRTKSRDA